MMGMLLPLGIEKGKDFKPDVATVARLNSAAAEAHAWLIRNNVPGRRDVRHCMSSRTFWTFGLTF
jgi:hypothetical protein